MRRRSIRTVRKPAALFKDYELQCSRRGDTKAYVERWLTIIGLKH